MEKKFLQKETHKLKNLNYHLEDRLKEQEQRLGAVSVELTKTWTLVGRMQRQHRQLHTHEQVLRYQLQQKRRMLGELKEELEYCRRKWALAREKNNESQIQWDTLRLEFSKRKEQDANNSAESGYSDGVASEDDDERTPEEIKRQRNRDDFESKMTASGRNMLRIHSTSPHRGEMSVVGVQRRQSDPQATQFATEVYQEEPGAIQITPAAGGSDKIVKNTVHMEATASSIVIPKIVEKAKVTEASILSSRLVPSTSTARKIVLPKVTGATSKLCFENRQKTVQKTGNTKKEESLEEMFCRLTGATYIEPEQPTPAKEPVVDEIVLEDEALELEDEVLDEVDGELIISGFEDEDTSERLTEENTTPDNQLQSIAETIDLDEQRRAVRAARIQRLEEQCKQLISQVTRASSRGDELSRQIDEVQKRYTPVRECPEQASRRSSSVPSNMASTSTATFTSEADKTSSLPSGETTTESHLPTTSENADQSCLTQKELDYTARRAERLKRLEAECKAFLSKVVTTNTRASSIDNKLTDLHERYGSNSVDSVDSVSTREETSSNETASEGAVQQEDISQEGAEDTVSEVTPEIAAARVPESLETSENGLEPLSESGENADLGSTHNANLNTPNDGQNEHSK